jgi:hypothetical protein
MCQDTGKTTTRRFNGLSNYPIPPFLHARWIIPLPHFLLSIRLFHFWHNAARKLASFRLIPIPQASSLFFLFAILSEVATK